MNMLLFEIIMGLGAFVLLVVMDKESFGVKCFSSTVNTTCPMCDKMAVNNPKKMKVTVREGADAKAHYVSYDTQIFSSMESPT